MCNVSWERCCTWSFCKTSRTPRRQHPAALSCLCLLCMQAGKVRPAVPSLQLNPPAAWSPRGCQQAAGQRLPLCGTRGMKAQVVPGLNTAAKRGAQHPWQAVSVSRYQTQSQNAHLPAPHVQLSKGEGCISRFIYSCLK